MKNNYLCWLGNLLLAGVLAAPAAAQHTPADTTHLRYGEEVVAPAAPAPLPLQRQERGVWKLGLNNFLVYADHARYGLHLAYEHQVGSPAWSILGEVSPALTYGHQDEQAHSSASAPTTGFAVRAQVAGRYYYNLERRLLRGRRIGGFSANYVALVLGTALTSEANREPAFFPVAGGAGASRAPAADVAVLYGLQRRLGRCGFLDASLGLGNIFYSGWQSGLVGSLRLGVVLGNPPSYPTRPVPAAAAASLYPCFYLGLGSSRVGYRVQYSAQDPYPIDKVELIGNETKATSYAGTPRPGRGATAEYAGPAPTLYVGYYLRPRLAVQLGAQYWVATKQYYTTFSSAAGPTVAVANAHSRATGLALPVLARYALTAAFLRRWQFDALGGLTLVRNTAEFSEYALDQRQVTSQQTAGFQRATLGLHATLGLAASYGLGHRRQLQATAELLAAKDVRTPLRVARFDDLPLSGSLGVRYRFGYR